MDFKTKLSKYLETLQTLRARNASEDQIRFSFLHFLEDAFPGLQFEELNLEQSVQIAGHGSGAKGVDTLSMDSALDARGTAVCVLADSLERAIRGPKEALSRGDLCLVTPYAPNAGFSVGAAMGRNRLIYCLADYAIVVASDAETGGTWAGATETLKNGWVPVFVLEHNAMPEGNKLLLQKGALAFPHPFKEPPVKLPEWMKNKAASLPTEPSQSSLF